MKETRIFYDPELAGQLPDEEARHAVRVLRLQQGDEIQLVDGRGGSAVAKITAVTGRGCTYHIVERQAWRSTWNCHLHVALAPTKSIDRVEWFAEKATELGFDELTFLNCRFSERRTVNLERIDKILISAMKQSQKALKPSVNGMTDFIDFVSAQRQGGKFICHCHEAEVKPFLLDAIEAGEDATVMIGPEGDFSPEEVQMALRYGYRAVSLGPSRLRTETAALAAVHIMQIKQM